MVTDDGLPIVAHLSDGLNKKLLLYIPWAMISFEQVACEAQGHAVGAYVLGAPSATVNAWINCVFPPFGALIPVSCPYINGDSTPLGAILFYSCTESLVFGPRPGASVDIR